MRNIDIKTVAGFGDQWTRFSQESVSEAELRRLFNEYFEVFPWEDLPANAAGFDLGSGSGRWARFVAERVGKLHCIDANADALEVARRNLRGAVNCEFHHASVDQIPLPDNSVDFGYSLGVLHHVPNTQNGITDCVRKLKPGAPFLLYLYYRFDNRPVWFQMLWRVSDVVRQVVSRMPNALRYSLSQVIAAFVYWPLSRLALALEKIGVSVQHLPLSHYKNLSFYSMRTDALDRFGTRLEQRFSAREIQAMMENAGLENIRFRNGPPYWCAAGIKK